MSLDMTSERVCYVHCNFCNTILAVSVPCSNMYAIVTVRCGHCANLLSVNIGALLQSLHHQELQKASGGNNAKESASSSSSSKCNINSSRYSKSTTTRPLLQLQAEHELPKITPIRPPEKRQRVPSAYNRFIKEEIQRIKATNPEITHREAFSTAAKNWAHFPHIHFGLNNNNKMEGNKQIAAGGSGGEGTNIHKSPAIGFY